MFIERPLKAACSEAAEPAMAVPPGGWSALSVHGSFLQEDCFGMFLRADTLKGSCSSLIALSAMPKMYSLLTVS